VAQFSCRRPQVVAGDNLGALTGQLGCRESAKGVDAGQRRYDRYPKELQPPRGQRLALSTEPAALQRALEQSRKQDNSRPELEYLWDLHPLVDWLADRGQITFPRHHAPVLQLSDGLDPGAVVMVFQGTIPNQKGVPVVQEWVAVRFAGTGLKVVAVEPFEAVAKRLQLGSRDLANISGEKPPAHLSSQLRFAVEQANTYLRDCGEQWTARVQPELERSGSGCGACGAARWSSWS
jgi:hypothetical protein